MANDSIGSQKYGACPNPTSWANKFRFLCRKDQRIVFCQYGILKDAAPGLSYKTTKLDLFICLSRDEFQYVHQCLHYPKLQCD